MHTSTPRGFSNCGAVADATNGIGPRESLAPLPGIADSRGMIRSPLSPVRTRVITSQSSIESAVRSVLAEIGPSVVGRAIEAGIHLPSHITVSANERTSRHNGETVCTTAGHLVRLTLPADPSVRWLRHLLAHEMGHVLIGQILGADDARGLVGEYVAERIGWEIVLRAGLLPGHEVAIPNPRIGQDRWLKELVEIVERLSRIPASERDPLARVSAPVEGLWRRRFIACYTLARSEAYALAVEHALGVNLPGPTLPPALKSALNDTVAGLIESPLPEQADADVLDEYLVLVGSVASSRLRDLVWVLVETLVAGNRDEFIRLASSAA